jgi:hypothetical protein
VGPVYVGGHGVATTGIAAVGSVLSLVLGVVAVISTVSIIGFLVILIVSNRADPDPTGRRPQSVYFFAVSFLSLLVAIVGSTAVFSSAVRFMGGHRGTIGNAVARAVVLGGLFTAVSLALLVTHLRRGLDLANAEGETQNPSRRVGQSYVSAASFVAIVLLLVATVVAVYLLFAIAGPGVFGSFGGRGTMTRILADTLYVGVVAVLILRTHRNLVPPGLQILAKRAVAAPEPTPADGT